MNLICNIIYIFLSTVITGTGKISTPGKLKCLQYFLPTAMLIISHIKIIHNMMISSFFTIYIPPKLSFLYPKEDMIWHKSRKHIMVLWSIVTLLLKYYLWMITGYLSTILCKNQATGGISYFSIWSFLPQIY